MSTVTLNEYDAEIIADLLEGFALALRHPDFPPSITAALAERLDDTGGARYGSPLAEGFIADEATSRADQLRAPDRQ